MNAFFRGFMLDQRTRKADRMMVAGGEHQTSLKDVYSGTRAGTNGLRVERSDDDTDVMNNAGHVGTDEDIQGRGRAELKPGDEAVAGMGGT